MERCEGPFAPNQPAASRLPTWPDGCYTLTHSPIPLSISLYLPPFSLSDCCTNQTLNACGLLFTRHSMRHETHTSDAAYRAAWELTGERKHVSLWSSWHAYITSKSMRVCVCVCLRAFIWDFMPLFQQRISNRACLIFFHQRCFFAVPGNFMERSGRRTVCLCEEGGVWNFMFRLNLSRGGNYCVYVHVCTLCCTFFTLSNQVKCDNPLRWPLSGVK